MKNSLLITNGKVVLPDRVLPSGEVYIEGGIIRHTGKTGDYRGRAADKTLNAEGAYVLPGFVDLHSDAIEKELEPRPGAYFTTDLAYSELEKKLAGQGITTMYHSFSFAGAEWGVRNDSNAANIIRKIVSTARRRSLIRNKVHLRFEITNYSGLEIVRPLLQDKIVDLLSFMDHTPGQGQYPTLEDYRQYMEKTYHLPLSEIENNVSAKEKGRSRAAKTIDTLRAEARSAGIPMASHDDDSPERVSYYRRLGVTINEFPINLDTAKAAFHCGNHVCVGSPNIVRGGSTGKGMQAMEAVASGVVNIICSDYYPPSMLQAVFKMAGVTMSLPEAVRMASLEPARAVGLDNLGSLEEGKWGDAIIVNDQDIPVVTHTVVAGIQVYGVNYRFYEYLGQQNEELPA